MLGDSSAVLVEAASSGDAVAVPPLAASTAAATTTTTHDGAESVAATAAGGSNSGDEDRERGEDGDRSFGGNRWPRQETLALLKIRSDMDVAFRDASVKGPLWDEVSRKLAKLGYHRSAKKCKEKFENVYKYHKRTKEGRSGKSDGKTYRFFDQLEALEHNPSFQSTTSAKAETAVPVSVVAASASTVPSTTVLVPTMAAVTNTTPHATVPSTTTTLPVPITAQGIVTPPSINLTVPFYSPINFAPSTANPTLPSSFPSIPTDLLSNSSSSSTSSDETLEGRRKRKRKWKDFFERLMKEVIEKQEDLQKRFLEAIEKREHERMVREEAWRMQEMARINREREILAQERSIAAAKDAAVMAFLQKIAEQQNLGQALNNINIPQPQLQPQPQPVLQQVAIQQHSQLHAGPPAVIPPAPQAVPQQQVTSMEITKTDNGDNFMAPSSSRWPKVEVQALIKLRADLDAKYQENGPKGPLWEEISSEMRKIGYNRSAKRCKEKWENINKYFKKVKESNKKRPEDAKTCPYFHQLDALYREKNKLDNPTSSLNQLNKPLANINAMTPLMVRPEQQWPPQQNTRPGADVTMEEAENHPMNRHSEDDGEEEDEDKDGDEDEEEDEGGGNYEIVASKPASVGAGAGAGAGGE
ncbi:hypothetical protein L6164_007176 [Bauhinia variegata]|uniref:Uncharacterized protein n=1 Tax=Bauhinia variegata TaxID=167791 RepID=A0ACB9PWP8_BAUVA|nr:hypothetical protein L6164_007176 [Bauhinia variegata]